MDEDEEEVSNCCTTTVQQQLLQLTFDIVPTGYTQPSTVVRKMEAQSEYTNIAYTFLHIWRRFVMLSVLSNKNFCIGAQSEVY